MALFQSGNPTLSEKIFDKSRYAEGQMQGVMTVRGTMNKFGFLMVLVIACAFYTWNLYANGQFQLMMTFFWVGLIGGVISGLVTSFKPNLAKYFAPAYALFEGFLLGAFSAIVNGMVPPTYHGIVMQAVGLTFGVAIIMFLLYNFRIIRPTEKFKSIIITATLGILLLYAAYWILGMFHVNLAFMNWGDTSMLGFGINVFVAVIAALSLILDFERIEVGADMGASKDMEWYGAFGLLVTMVWLYIQILKLLSRFANSRN